MTTAAMAAGDQPISGLDVRAGVGKEEQHNIGILR